MLHEKCRLRNTTPCWGKLKKANSRKCWGVLGDKGWSIFGDIAAIFLLLIVLILLRPDLIYASLFSFRHQWGLGFKWVDEFGLVRPKFCYLLVSFVPFMCLFRDEILGINYFNIWLHGFFYWHKNLSDCCTYNQSSSIFTGSITWWPLNVKIWISFYF